MSFEEQTRKITDARAMRALAHPVRLALLELLNLEGTLTATQAAEKIRESPSSCSFHLRQLAKYGFAEEAGGGTGRQRPWRRVGQGFSLERFHPDSETSVAAEQLERTMVERYLGELENWYRTRDSYPDEWQDAAGMTETIHYVTPEELRALHENLFELLSRYRDRVTDKSTRPAGSLPVEVLTFAYPKQPPADQDKQ